MILAQTLIGTSRWSLVRIAIAACDFEMTASTLSLSQFIERGGRETKAVMLAEALGNLWDERLGRIHGICGVYVEWRQPHPRVNYGG